MPTDLLDQISAINPLPEDVDAPPIASLPTLPERDALPDRVGPPRSTRVRRAFPKRALLALPIAALVLGLALLGRGGGGFDVAAAVYKATTAGNGVHFMFLEGEAGSVRVRYRRWSTSDPGANDPSRRTARRASKCSAAAASSRPGRPNIRGRSCAYIARHRSAGGIP